MANKEIFYKRLLDNITDGIYFVNTDRKITYWNKSAENITGYKASEVVNSYCSDNILVHVDDKGNELCKNDCPVKKTIDDSKERKAEIFLHHKKGHRIPVYVTVSPIKNPKGKIIGAIELFRENTGNIIDKETIDNLKKAALLDPLTGVANRRFVEMKLRSCFEDFKRHDVPFGILFTDIDFFKKINDTYGHNTGDEVLIMVAKTIENNLRKTDLIGRWGGEEFIGVITYVNKKQLEILAEKLRTMVESSFIQKDNTNIKVTITIGATLANPKDTIEVLVNRADELLYTGKDCGRNCLKIG